MNDFFRKVIKTLFQHGFLYTVLCLIGGLLFTIWSKNATTYIVFALMGLVAVYGIFCIVKYFLIDKQLGTQNALLFQGIIALEIDALGVAYYLGMRNIPLLLYLGTVFTISSMRLQCMADMFRRQVRIWYVFLIIFIFLLMLAVLPFVFSISIEILYLIMGIALLVEFVDDLFCRVIIKSMDQY